MQNRIGFFGTMTTLFSLTLGFSTPAALADPPNNYIGGGVRAEFNDDTAAVIHAKIKVLDLGKFSLSGRPALVIGNSAELRLAATGEADIAPRLSPYGGGGIAINKDGSGDVDPLLTAGLDVTVIKQVVLQVGGNLIFSNGTDAELTATVNYAF
ncbi:MAG: hypothetical protein WA902_21515 [Thermosynechococcaceae cyanobacterium]